MCFQHQLFQTFCECLVVLVQILISSIVQRYRIIPPPTSIQTRWRSYPLRPPFTAIIPCTILLSLQHTNSTCPQYNSITPYEVAQGSVFQNPNRISPFSLRSPFVSPSCRRQTVGSSDYGHPYMLFNIIIILGSTCMLLLWWNKVMALTNRDWITPPIHLGPFLIHYCSNRLPLTVRIYVPFLNIFINSFIHYCTKRQVPLTLRIRVPFLYIFFIHAFIIVAFIRYL